MAYKYYIGIDCANRTFAWSYVRINTDTRALTAAAQHVLDLIGSRAITMDDLANEEFARRIRAFDAVGRDVFVVLECGVDDILGANVSEFNDVSRARLLRDYLDKHPILGANSDRQCDGVFIEHQPPRMGITSNQKSTAVANQLIFYFAHRNPRLVCPKLKNSIAPTAELSVANFTGGNEYLIRKKHSRAILLFLAKTFAFEDKIAHVKKKVLSDLADSVVQIYAFLSINGFSSA